MIPDLHDWRPGIPGWSADILPYYQRLAGEIADGETFVEVGVHSGRSIFYLAEQLLRLGKPRVRLIAVDAWEGKNFREQILHTIVGNRFNGVTAEEIDMVKILCADGALAARLFADGELAGVFLDADHTYDGMWQHLGAWRRKVKSGGVLAGHDYSKADWPGVVEAVDGYFRQIVLPVGRPTRTVWEVVMP
jgi:cephalosporin hydroxylase